MAAVLCTNGLLSKTLAVVRSMGRQGIRTVVGEKTRFHASGFSKYADKTVVYPDPVRHPEPFYEWLCETIVREKIDFLFPMDDDVMDIVVSRQDGLGKLCRILVPSPESYRIAADKSLTMRLAEGRNVPCPRTAETSFGPQVDPDELLAVTSALDYPLCIKPRVGSGSRGVRFVNDAAELIAVFQDIHLTYPNPLIQEAVSYGGKYGVCLCYDDNHAVRAAFVQREVRNFPEERGPSVVQESIYDEKMLDYTKRLMDGIPWRGVVEVDYMVDSRTGEPKLMEINPRYWASLNLALACGIDFPFMHYRLGVGADPEPMLAYKEGVFGRQLLPGDILHFLASKKRWRQNPPFFTTKLKDDVISRDDPWPAAGFLVSALRYCLDLKMWRFLITR
ncbi:ATP-grasp domain-containing protein [Paenibacillus sp. N4]|uniref:carboxylate--amine ligase n=1 Tax=Paenibacillus vietnamensis TaxID=2590547 RepID=UPI001CD112ED|nr:ATP-grasp domain-containing protein [Paenibacillus vietnamensis]MCA0756662.1 ATP-grasp domain-containing protein [Paenibacillus vietnamensis]